MPESTPRLDLLLREVNCCCLLRRGRKADLARFLDVRPSQVNEWLTSKRAHPSAEYALGMVVWLGEQHDADDEADERRSEASVEVQASLARGRADVAAGRVNPWVPPGGTPATDALRTKEGRGGPTRPGPEATPDEATLPGATRRKPPRRE